MKRSSALAGFALVLGLIVMLSIFSLWGIDLPGVLAAPTGTGPWYVSTTGNDSNTCLGSGDAAACRTISNTISLATSGDVINIAAGTYTENLTVTK